LKKQKIPAKNSGASKVMPTATMADVARLAGVSTMTVSRALRNNTPVASQTRDAVMQAVETLGYVLDQSAGSLSSKRTGFVAALIPSINNSNFADTARGLTDAIKGSGLQLLLGYTDYSSEKEEELIEAMLRRRPEAMVVTGGKRTMRARKLLESAKIPVIETWDLPANPINHVVGFSNAEAIESLVQYLYQKGYRAIGFIGGTGNRDTRGADRKLGFERAMAGLGLDSTRGVSFGLPPISIQQGGEALARMMEQWPDTEAVICVSDLSAFGAIIECQRRGWAVPGKVAIAGFGDFEISSCLLPAITTVGVNCHMIGHRAGELLLRAIEGDRAGKPIGNQTVLIDYAVIGRASA
jgi:LacI family transcriptional regulator, gluconate utilization system Gnt-I transcriptional repressor